MRGGRLELVSLIITPVPPKPPWILPSVRGVRDLRLYHRQCDPLTSSRQRDCVARRHHGLPASAQCTQYRPCIAAAAPPLSDSSEAPRHLSKWFDSELLAGATHQRLAHHHLPGHAADSYLLFGKSEILRKRHRHFPRRFARVDGCLRQHHFMRPLRTPTPHSVMSQKD